MSLLQVINDAPGYVKATFQGPQGSGKTRTAVELAAITHKHFGLKTPVAFFDTETGSDYVAGLIQQYTGLPPIRVKTRAFADLSAVVQECVLGASQILIVDSITHVWRELQDGYMKKINAGRPVHRQKKRMDIQDIMAIKQLWGCWPDAFLNTPLHIIVCGREGSEWGNQENEETGKLELVQVGKKMKVEAEFGYEASLMVAMSREDCPETLLKTKAGKRTRRMRRIINVATVLKDRFDVMNGQAFEMPAGETFLPFLKCLTPGNHHATDCSVKSDGQLPEMDDNGWTREKRQRVAFCEEIQGELLAAYPGQTAVEKRAKGEMLKTAFGTYSWTKVENLDSQTLEAGLGQVRSAIAAGKAGHSEVNQVEQALAQVA